MVTTLLARKARRDVGRQRGQFVAVALTVALATCAFVAALGAYENLQASYETTYSRLSFADLVASGRDAPQLAAAAERAKGVAVTERLQADLGVRPRPDHSLRGRLVGLPDDGTRPAVNRPLVTEGAWPRGDQVLVETHLAKRWHIRPGATVGVAAADGSWHLLRVAGVAASPEYLYPARSRQELVTTPEDFGVVFAQDQVVKSLAGPAAVQQAALYTVDRSRAATVTGDLEQQASRLSLVEVTTRATHPSAAALSDDINGIRTMAFLFPVLFLTAGALAAWVLLGRLVHAQRAVIGTLLASGLPRRRLLGHYLAFGVGTALAGALLGAVGGHFLGGWMTTTYTDALGIPLTLNRLHPIVLVAGVGVAVLAGALAGFGPARMATRLAPAETMRATTPPGRGRRSLIERLLPPLRRLPARWAMVLRNIGRSRRRSIATAAGTALAVALILVSWGMLDTSNILLARQYGDVQRESAQVDLTPAIAPQTIASLGAVSGVAAVEPAVRAPVVLAHGQQRYSSLLIALPQTTKMHGFHVVGSGEQAQPKQGLLVGLSLQGRLGLRVGDQIQASVPGTDVNVRDRVAGFVDEPFGAFAYASLEHLKGLAPGSIVNAAFIGVTPNADRLAVRAAVNQIPGVVGYTDIEAVHNAIRDQMGLFYALLGIMLAFGAAMAAALCFNAMSANVAERSGEIAALRVAGMPNRLLRRILSVENLTLAAAGLPFGVIAGVLLARGFLSTYVSDIYRWSLQLHWWTPLVAAAAVFVAAAIAQVPALRTAGSIDLGRVVRERSL